MLEMFPLELKPNWGLSDDPSADIHEYRLGDGYIIRRPKGINYLRDTWSPTWDYLTPEQAEDNYQWLKARLKLTPFLWEHPTTKEIKQVVCTKVTRIISTYGNSELRATFEEDFNP